MAYRCAPLTLLTTCDAMEPHGRPKSTVCPMEYLFSSTALVIYQPVICYTLLVNTTICLRSWPCRPAGRLQPQYLPLCSDTQLANLPGSPLRVCNT